MTSPATITRVLGLAIGITAAAAASAQTPVYDITIVDAYATTTTRTTLLWGLNDSNIACGTTDVVDTVNGSTSVTTGGFYWNAPNNKTRIPVTGPHAINNNGLIAATNAVYDIQTGQTTTTTGLPGNSRAAVLLGINDGGTAVGYIQTCTCSNSQGLQQIPYVWNAATGARTLNVPGATGAGRINNAGLVVGWIGGRAATNGYVYDLNTNQYTLISSLFPAMLNGFTPHGTADDISENNLVTGTILSPDATVTQGYLWHYGDSSATILPDPPAGFTRDVHPQGVNNAGTVVGWISPVGDNPHAFVYDQTNGVRDLNTLVNAPGLGGFILRGAQQINENGVIVGYGQGGGGLYKAFVLVPRAPACRSDFNGQGGITVQDIFDYLSAWFAGETRSDFNGQDGISVQDIFDFLSAWFGGC